MTDMGPFLLDIKVPETVCRWCGRQTQEMTVITAWISARGKEGLCPPVVSDIIGLLLQGGKNGCCIVRYIHSLDLCNSQFYCTSTNHIQLTANRYSSIALTIYLYDVALSGSLAGLKLCGPGSRPKPLNLC